MKVFYLCSNEKKNLGKEFSKIETRFTKLKYVHLYENFSEKNYNKNLSSDQVSVSEHIKDRKNFSQKKPKLFLNRRFVLTIECFIVGLKNWLERV